MVIILYECQGYDIGSREKTGVNMNRPEPGTYDQREPVADLIEPFPVLFPHAWADERYAKKGYLAVV